MARKLVWTVALTVVLALAPAVRAAESYFGFDLDLLAKSFAYLTTYRTEYGEAAGNERFAEWAAGRGRPARASTPPTTSGGSTGKRIRRASPKPAFTLSTAATSTR